MIAIQATGQQKLSTAQLDSSTERFHTPVRQNALPRESQRDRKAGPTSTGGWLEDAFNMILLCTLAVAMLGVAGMFARMVFGEIARIGTYELMMMIGG